MNLHKNWWLRLKLYVLFDGFEISNLNPLLVYGFKFELHKCLNKFRGCYVELQCKFDGFQYIIF